MHTLSDEKRREILSSLQKGQSIRKVADACRISKSTVQRIRKGCLSKLPTANGGRPSKLSPQTKRLCVRGITSGKHDTAASLARTLQENTNLSISERTVRRALQENGLAAKEKEKKPRLSAKNIKERLEFARRHKHWTIADWKRVIWSDETKINRFCSDGRSWCWVRDGEVRNQRHVKQTVKHGGGSLMIWGCMAADGPGFMCKITGTMDQHLYLAILQGELLRTIDWYGIEPGGAIFQHDNDPKHKAKSVQSWLSEQPFSVLEWPPQSPDLNPIEHLWAIVKRRLAQYDNPPSGMVELWERIEEVWENIGAEECKSLVESMPKRIEAVLKARGMWTDY
jgi:transposase